MASDDHGGLLSRLQRQLWLMEHAVACEGAYNCTVSCKLTGALDVARLEAALQDVFARHSALRTRFVRVAGGPVRVVDAPGSRVIIEEVRELAPEAVHGVVSREGRRPFALDGGVLSRILLLRVAADDHTMVFSFHHSIIDGWSLKLLAHQVLAVYAGVAIDARSSFSEYVAHEIAVLATPALQYWKDLFADGEPEPLPLPFDRARPAQQAPTGRSVPIVIPAETVRALSQGRERKRFTRLLAGFAAFLSRYAGVERVCVGVPFFGNVRARVSGEHAIGPFYNVLPLFFETPKAQSFEAFAAAVAVRVEAALAHSEVPFESIVDAVVTTRPGSRSPLFQALLNFQGKVPAPRVVDGLHVRFTPISSNQCGCDLQLELFQDETELRGWISYDPALFDAATIDALSAAFLHFLRAVTDAPELPLAVAPVLTPAQYEQVVHQWNDTQVDFGDVATVPELFLRAVARSPDAVAVRFGETTLSYQALEERSREVAVWLRTQGVGADVRVGIMAERSIEMVVAMLAVLRAGGAYMPLDPSHPPARLQQLIEVADARIVLTVENIPAAAGALDVLPAGADLAYLMFTSGSTGTPKGVMNTHAGISNRLRWAQTHFQVGPADVVLHKTAVVFDVSVVDVFLPLISGAQLVLAPEGTQHDPKALVRAIVDHGVTTVHFGPSQLALFIGEPSVGACNGVLRRVFCSGEVLTGELQRRFFAVLSAELHNLYGPTEAAVDVTSFACNASDKRALVPIGRPVANTQIYLLDADGQPAALGMPGEIVIGGVQVARGYLGRDAGGFVGNPIPDTPSRRLYRTGDIGRYAAGGVLEFLGRRDDQVKLRGQRIEPGEIEAVIHALSGARVAVVARQDPLRGLLLIAYVVGPERDWEELRTQLGERLPQALIPNHFAAIDRIPLTRTGKRDVRAFPLVQASAELTRARQRRGASAPPTPREQALCEIARSTLHVSGLEVEDDLFATGVNSLTLTQFVLRARDAGFALTPTDVVGRASVRGLVAKIDRTGVPRAQTTAFPAVTARFISSRPRFCAIMRSLEVPLDAETVKARLEALAGLPALRLRVSTLAGRFVASLHEALLPDQIVWVKGDAAQMHEAVAQALANRGDTLARFFVSIGASFECRHMALVASPLVLDAASCVAVAVCLGERESALPPGWPVDPAGPAQLPIGERATTQLSGERIVRGDLAQIVALLSGMKAAVCVRPDALGPFTEAPPGVDVAIEDAGVLGHGFTVEAEWAPVSVLDAPVSLSLVRVGTKTVLAYRARADAAGLLAEVLARCATLSA